jgi:phosphate transport system ATP-binding protein
MEYSIMEMEKITENTSTNIEPVDIKNPVILTENLSISYDGKFFAVKDVSVKLKRNAISAIMGPSGCGKSTLLRAFNRMHYLYNNIIVNGTIKFNDININEINPIELRRNIGMVFQRPNPFHTMSIYDNVISGFKVNGIKLTKKKKDDIVESTLNEVGLWDEVKQTLNKKGTFLSGGQQQRLCVARALANNPEVLLLDEPTSSLDPIATKKIEDLLLELKEKFTIIIVTHNMGQAQRISDYSLFMYLGELIEYGKTKKMFHEPEDDRTKEYLTGKFG